MQKLLVLLLLAAALALYGFWPARTTPASEPLAAPGTEAPAAASAEPAAPPATRREAGPEASPSDRSKRRADDATLRVRLLASAGEGPVAGVGATLAPLWCEEPWAARLRAVSDAAGLVRFEGLAPGRWHLVLDRGPQRELELSAGLHEIEVVLPPGSPLTGRVVDPAGQPVARARIWLGAGERGAGQRQGQCIAESGPDGCFVLAALGAPRLISAWHDDFAPSCTVLTGPGAGPCELRLGGPGAALRLAVVSADQARPIPAWFRIGHAFGLSDERSCEGQGTRRTPAWEAHADAEGHALVRGLPPGRHVLSVRAPGHAPWAEFVELAPGATTELRVVLQAGVEVAGRIHDPDGRPVPNALVICASWSSRTEAEVRSGPDGSYRLQGVDPALLRLRVVASGFREHRDVLRAVPGPIVRWDCRLERALALRGCVRHADATPAAGAVLLRGPDGERHVGALDEQGRFVVDDVAEAPHTLYHCPKPRGHAGSRAYRRVEGLAPLFPRAEEWQITLPAAPPRPAAVSGRLVDGAARPLAGAGVQVHQLDAGGLRLVQWRAARPSDANGRYRVEALPAGRYRLEFRPAGAPLASVSTEPFELLPAAELELGDTRWPELGELELLLRGAEAAGAQLLCQIDGEDGQQRITRLSAARERLALVPGPYRVTIYGAGLVHRSRRVQVVAGERRELGFAVTPGVQRQLEWDFAGAAHAEHIGLCTVRLAHVESPLVIETELDLRQRASAIWWPTLLPGHYAVQFAAEGFPPLQGRFVVPSLAPSLAPIVVPLR